MTNINNNPRLFNYGSTPESRNVAHGQLRARKSQNKKRGKTTLIDVTIKKTWSGANQNQTLLPFAMESLGKFRKQGYDYINQVAADYGEHYRVARYWFRKISIALQAGIGQAASYIMKDWLNGKTRDEEQIQDDIDRYHDERDICTPYSVQIKLCITCYTYFCCVHTPLKTTINHAFSNMLKMICKWSRKEGLRKRTPLCHLS